MDTLPAEDAAVQDSEERFRLLVESVRDYAIFMLDPDGRIVSWNAGAERIKGYQAEQVLGRHFSVFYPPADIAAGKPPRELEVAAAEGRLEDEGWRLRRDGSQFWANVVITALRDETGALVGFAKVTRDLSERKRAEEERVARLAAEAALREREAFLAVAAHELKTPLTSLRAFVQLLSRRLDSATPFDPQRTRQALAQVEEQTGKLNRLADQLLDLTRLDAGRLAIARAEVDLAALAVDAVQAARLRAGDHRLTVGAPPTLLVPGDARRLQRVLVNLLDNALKYAPHGPIAITVDAPDAATARVQVRDRGPGIPGDKVEHVFDRFYQVRPGDDQGGLGLSLYLSRQIAELHGGALTIESPPDGGSCVVLTLPRSDGEPANTVE